MESSQGTKAIDFMKWIKIGVPLLILGIILLLLNKFGLFKSNSAVEKLKDAADTKNEAAAIDFKQSDILQPIKITDFLKTGVGAAELKNQFPYMPKQVTDMITGIYKDKPAFGYSEGVNTIAVINSLPSKFAFNRLASSFSAIYGDLMTWLDKNLHEDAIAAIKRSNDLKPDFNKLLAASQTLLTKNKQTLKL